jgi:hypothetical protein
MAKEFKKTSIILGILFLTLLTTVIVVSATTYPNVVTFIAPTNGQVLSGNVTIQITNVTSTFNKIENCTFYIKSPSTANNSWVNMGTFLNTTIKYVNGTYNTTFLEDSNDYTLNATCRNQSNDIGYATIIVTTNNTIPDAPSSLSPSTNTVISNPQTLSISSTVTDSKTTGCTHTIYRYNSASDSNSASGTSSYSSSNCSFTKAFTTTSDNGEYYIVFTASDGTNTVSNSPIIINVQIPGSGGGSNGIIYDNQGRIVNAVEPVQSNNGYWIIGIIVVLAIIALIVLLIMFW